VGMYDQTLPFYLGRTLKLVKYVDEFELGIKAQPELQLATLDEFRADWVRPGEALAIMHPDTYQDIRSRGLPMQLVHEDPRRILVRKP
jgi:Aminoarabinose transferase C-terminal domain